MGNKKTQTIVIAAAVVAFLGMAYHLYGLIKQAGDRWPHRNVGGSLTAINRNLTNDVQKLLQDEARIPPAREELEAKRVEYQLATRVLPRESTFDQLIAAIRTKTQQAGIYLSRLAPSVVGGSGPFEEWRFSLDARGTYDQIASFVNRMEEFDSSEPSRVGSEKRFFQLSSINIVADARGMAFAQPPPNDGTPSSRGHACQLVMHTYRFTGED